MNFHFLLIRMSSPPLRRSAPDAAHIARRWRGSAHKTLMAVLPPLNFLTLHYVYFIVTGLVSSVIFYLTSTPWQSVAYVDAIFLCVSAMTGAGLNTVCTSYLATDNMRVSSILGELVNSKHIPASYSFRAADSRIGRSHLQYRAHGTQAGL